jgi:hypothetical protein
VVIVILLKAYIIMCEVGYVIQYNVPPLSLHVTLLTNIIKELRIYFLLLFFYMVSGLLANASI